METIYKSIENDMLQVNMIVLEHIKSEELLVETIGKYLVDAAGKRLRPMLTILCSKLFGYSGHSHVHLAAAVEFIHTATLLHDDVVDESTMRRFKPTANTVWGNKTSILVGDFLFSQSFKLMISAGSMDALASLANASVIIAEGEVMQLTTLTTKNFITESAYYQIINAKTAELFGTACEVGGIISGQNAPTNKHLRQFGLKLGAIFQIADDLLDYFGSHITTGKNIGDDLAEGKITLPIILVYNQSSPNERLFLEQTMFANNRVAFADIVALMTKYQIKEQISKYMDGLILEGLASLNQIQGQEPYQTHLASLLSYAASRNG